MESLKCPNCGADLMVDDKMFFCPYCGVGIPRVEKKAPLNIRQTNQAVTVIQNNGPKTIVDKFLEHRQAMKVVHAETKISKNEEQMKNRVIEAELKRRAKEAEMQIAAEQKEKARIEHETAKELSKAEIQKEIESRKTAWGCAAIVMSPILIPLALLLFLALKVIFKF